jgi:hypothetical protein
VAKAETKCVLARGTVECPVPGRLAKLQATAANDGNGSIFRIRGVQIGFLMFRRELGGDPYTAAGSGGDKYQIDQRVTVEIHAGWPVQTLPRRQGLCTMFSSCGKTGREHATGNCSAHAIGQR